MTCDPETRMPFRRALLLVLACAALATCRQPAADPTPPLDGRAHAGDRSASGADAPSQRFAFDEDQVGRAPAGFSSAVTGGPPGRWEVVADPSAPSAPHVLAQLDADLADGRFPLAILDGPALRDLRLSVRCKPVAGSVDQAVGLAFRYRDAENYYVTRANALEGNIRLYFVKDGLRRQIATWDGAVSRDVWHDYRVEARGDRIEVSWDGQKVIEVRDATFPEAGASGLWTKADSVSHFDDLVIEPL